MVERPRGLTFAGLVSSLALASLLLASRWAQASIAASGTFDAREACAAFVSKNRRTNPDAAALIPGTSYPVLEVNRVSQPDWYRVRVDGASPTERWVPAACGRAEVRLADSGGGDRPPAPQSADRCRTAGRADSFKLALSWQPAFCERHRAKPECRVDDPRAYQARNFTLHGLWPNLSQCGTRYGFCGEVQRSPGEFCDYPAIELYAETRASLEEVMPSARANSCLERHEWHKHGTCQNRWSLDEYYALAVDLARQFNESGIAYFMSRRLGGEVSLAEFEARVDCALGDGAHERLRLSCRDGNLVDVYVNLPRDLAPGEDLAAAIARAPPDAASSCGTSFRVDPIGYQ